MTNLVSRTKSSTTPKNRSSCSPIRTSICSRKRDARYKSKLSRFLQSSVSRNRWPSASLFRAKVMSLNLTAWIKAMWTPQWRMPISSSRGNIALEPRSNFKHREPGHGRDGKSRRAGVTVWGSLQCPYYVHKALVTLFGLPAEKNSRDSSGNRVAASGVRKNTRRLLRRMRRCFRLEVRETP